MKVFIVLALAAMALAEPESDPAYLTYGTYGLPAYGTYGYRPLVAPAVSTLGYSNFYNYGLSGYYGQRLIKRESEPESDPALLYKTYSAYTPYYQRPILPAVTKSVVPAYSTYNYGYTTPLVSSVYGLNPFYRSLYKREAEPESDPELVYTDGQFHTNLRNLHKGVHLNKALPYGSIYDVQRYAVPTVVKPAVNSYQPTYSTYGARSIVPYHFGLY